MTLPGKTEFEPAWDAVVASDRFGQVAAVHELVDQHELRAELIHAKLRCRGILHLAGAGRMS